MTRLLNHLTDTRKPDCASWRMELLCMVGTFAFVMLAGWLAGFGGKLV